MQWYRTNFCSRRDWIIDNAENLNLTNDELLFCLVIDFLKEHNIEISNEILKKKLKLESTQLDQLIRNLTIKGYLDICSKEELFDLKGLYEANGAHPKSEALFESIFDVFDEVFGRPLNQDEYAKLSDLSNTYSSEEIIDALRKAEAYNKVSMPYITTILRGNK